MQPTGLSFLYQSDSLVFPLHNCIGIIVRKEKGLRRGERRQRGGQMYGGGIKFMYKRKRERFFFHSIQRGKRGGERGCLVLFSNCP